MATETNWFYGRGGQQNGPVTAAQMKNLITRGQIAPADMVWREGMPNWIPARDAAELAHLSPPSAGSAPVPVGYYTSTMGMPARALENLKGHARPTGDTGDWPLDEFRMQQFEQTVKLRKRVASAASLYRGLLLLSGISLGVMVPMMIFMLQMPRSGAPRIITLMPLTVFVAITAGFTILYYFTHRATRRSYAWAPLTMFIIYLITLLVQLASAAMIAAGAGTAMGGAPSTAPQIVGTFVGILFEAAFAVVSWRGFVAIRKYLAQPAWCQELIVKAGL